MSTLPTTFNFHYSFGTNLNTISGTPLVTGEDYTGHGWSWNPGSPAEDHTDTGMLNVYSRIKVSIISAAHESVVFTTVHSF